jgi:hypothetical protein
MENKNNFVEARTLNNQEWHLALEMSISKTAHTERERERESTLQNNIKAKPEQLNLSKTYPSS